MRHPVALFHAKAQDVGDPVFALSEPARVVVEQEVNAERLTRSRLGEPLEFVVQKIAAHDQAQHLPGGHAPLSRSEDDVAGDGQGVLLHAIADVRELILRKGQSQLGQTAAHKDTQQTKLRGGAHDHVAAVGRRAPIAHDRDAVGLELPFVQQLVIGRDPFGQRVGVVERLLERLALQRDAPRGKEVLAFDGIGLVDDGADSPHIGPARCGLPRAGQERGRLQLVLARDASI